MSTESPLFSIVIPTRNRAHLLPHALKSALNQDFDDYEIVIVANDCQDNTKEVVEHFTNSRVRYFETNKMLTMPENWEYAWTKAKGKYITYLPDDDALAPCALKLLATHALEGNPPVVSWEDAVYYYPNWNDPGLQNILLLFFHGDDLVHNLDAKTMLRELAHFEFAWSSSIPKLLNCAVNRDFFEVWRNKLGRLFFPIAPDYSFAWISTQVCDSIRVVRRPLSLRGISDYSIGSNAGLGEASKKFFNEFGDFDFFSITENNLPLSINHLAATFLRVNSALSKEINVTNFDINAFYIALSKQLIECKNLLDDWDTKTDEFLKKVNEVVPSQYTIIKYILSADHTSMKRTETLREMHHRSRKMALEYLPNINIQLKRYTDDLDCALCSLSLKEEVLVDSDWSYLYLFGEKIKANNIYDFSLYIDRYYDLLINCRNKKCDEIQTGEENMAVSSEDTKISSHKSTE